MINDKETNYLYKEGYVFLSWFFCLKKLLINFHEIISSSWLYFGSFLAADLEAEIFLWFLLTLKNISSTILAVLFMAHWILHAIISH